MHKLNLPAFQYKIREINGKAEIFDIIRKKFIVLTPEEWVRQHFVHLLINHYQYPKSLIRIESGLKYNQLQKRTDIRVYDRDGSIYLIVECKSADIKISQVTFEQIARYSFSIKSKYIAVSNGLQNFCCMMNDEKGNYEFINDLPAFTNPA